MHFRAGDARRLFPASLACKDGLPFITKRARNRQGAWVRRGTRQGLTLFPGLGVVVHQLGDGVGWVYWRTSSWLKYTTFLAVVHDRGVPSSYVALLGFVDNSTVVAYQGSRLTCVCETVEEVSLYA